MVTKDDIHIAICNMPSEKKIRLAFLCARYGVSPERVEQTVSQLINASIEPAKKYLEYWENIE